MDYSTADRHQLKICKDTIRNPYKALLGGPSVADAEVILRTKFKLTEQQIENLRGDGVPRGGS